MFILLLVLGASWGWTQDAFRARGQRDPLTVAVHLLLEPGAAGFRSMRYGIESFWMSLSRGRELRQENDRLRGLAATVSLYEERIDSVLKRLDSVRALLKLPTANRKPLGADVIGYYPNDNLITITAGADKGVRRGMPVMAAAGLVGVVDVVGPNSSEVLLVSSPRRKIGAKTLGDPPATGLLRGETTNRLILDVLESASSIAAGDEVETLGMSKAIPPNLPIGRVIEVARDREFGTTRAVVSPHVRLAELHEVVVLR